MSNLRSAKQILQENDRRPIYAIAVASTWPYYDPDDCPRPVREWIAKHHPDTTIERIECLGSYRNEANSDVPDMPDTVYYLGFTDDQANHFRRSWSIPPLEDLCSDDDICFLNIRAVAA
jgi:hypothetical protein